MRNVAVSLSPDSIPVGQNKLTSTDGLFALTDITFTLLFPAHITYTHTNTKMIHELVCQVHNEGRKGGLGSMGERFQLQERMIREKNIRDKHAKEKRDRTAANRRWCNCGIM